MLDSGGKDAAFIQGRDQQPWKRELFARNGTFLYFSVGDDDIVIDFVASDARSHKSGMSVFGTPTNVSQRDGQRLGKVQA